MKNERFDVEFRTKASTSYNCTCTACHGIGRVTKLRLPVTLYHKGRVLITERNGYWLCETCRDKLIQALMDSKEDE